MSNRVCFDWDEDYKFGNEKKSMGVWSKKEDFMDE